MTASFRRHARMLRVGDRTVRSAVGVVATFLCAAVASCSSSGDGLSPDPSIKLSSIAIDSGSRVLERGTAVKLTVTARDTANKVVDIPVAWRTTVDSIATIDKNGLLTAGDTGVAFITASALGVTSAPIRVDVIWVGAAKIEAFHFTPPVAVTPGAVFGDSLRVLVRNRIGGPAAHSVVRFAVTAGNGALSEHIVESDVNGLAATQWTFGAESGANTVTAAVVKADSVTPTPWVDGNPVSFSVTTFAALSVVTGDAQSAQILAALPTAPAIKLVDANGNPRAGVPITFLPTANGRVGNTVVSTGADGVASPGTWTLGDATGDQQLVVTVENARVVLHATATGTAIHFAASDIAASAGATCARTSDQLVSCFGAAALTGRNESTPRATPAATTGGVAFKNVVGGSSHLCGVGADASVYCWGTNALVDTTGATVSTNVPTRLPSDTQWQAVTPGGSHNCALATDRTAFCWGINTSGQLGDGGTVNRAAPRPVVGGFHFTALAAGVSHECGLATDANIYCWGDNSAAQLGNGTAGNALTPTVVSGADRRFTAVAAGGNWTCALNTSGKAECWGAGTGHTTPQAYATAPEFTSISVGVAHACALTSDGSAYCWGDNSGGQLGDSTQTTRLEPTAVKTTLRFASISAGVAHTCAVALDSSVVCWGRNQVGELGFEPPPTIQSIPRFVVTGVQP